MSHSLGVGRRAALQTARRMRAASSAAPSAASALSRSSSSAGSAAAAAASMLTSRLPNVTAASTAAAAAASYSSLSGRNVLSSSSVSASDSVASGQKQIRHMSSDDLPYHLVVGMPALSPTMEAGTIAEWNVREGDAFAAGDSVAEIETDKATIAFEAQDDGYVAKILVEAGSGEIPVGTPVMVTVEEEEDIAAFKDFVAPETASGGAAPAAATEEAPAAAAAPAAANPAAAAAAAPVATPARDVPPEFALMPSARSISQSAGVDATVLEGTGKGGRVTKGDVLKALKDGVYMPPLAAKAADAAPAAQAAAAPAAPAAAASPIDVTIPPITTDSTYEDVPNNNMRKVIAKRLTESKSQVPHFYTTVQIELDAALALRKQLANNHDVKVSVNDLVIRSAALALRDVPEVNATYNPKTNMVSTHDTVDISVAVATPTGLITPIVPQTSTLGLSEISASVKDLATRARDGKLAPEEYQGGTFCISNLGMFGITEFSAVINPPQAAILAVGGGVKTVVPGEWIDDEEKNASDAKRRPTVKTLMTARLSADRRVVDETTAALFLSSLNKYLAKPELLML